MLALNIYNTFYSSGSSSQGVAQAKAVLFFILVAGLGLIQLWVTRKREVQQSWKKRADWPMKGAGKQS